LTFNHQIFPFQLHQNGHPLVVKNVQKFLKRCEDIWAKRPDDMYPNVSADESTRTLTEDGNDSMVPCVSRDHLGEGEGDVDQDDDDAARVPEVQGIRPVVRRRTLLSRSQEMDDEDTIGMVRANEVRMLF
jgi:hypothetical protein